MSFTSPEQAGLLLEIVRENPIGAHEGPGSYIHRIAVLAGLVKADERAVKDMPRKHTPTDAEWEAKRQQLLATAGKSE